ncbi:MAG: addiction module toxin RelE [Peptostreptococcaceae bacterium]|jgi:hypothetical protein|nr:addiction module toxin RelE [Peptostreptococcaceae bacterium]
MATNKKYKKLTNKEKELRKQIRQEMREEGLLPPKKQRLNRKKFTQETMEEFKNNFGAFSDLDHLYSAINFMIADTDFEKINLEHIGIVKTLKVALEIKKFMEDKKANGETKYSPVDLYKNVVKPIKDL